MVIFSSAFSLVARTSLVVMIMCALVACQTVKEPEAVAAVVEPIASAPVAITPQQKQIKTLLAAADSALSVNRLLNPINDNAYDRYKAVLLMDPQNEKAKLGLQTISLRYVDLARSAAVSGNLNEAQTMIRYARGIDNNAVVQDAETTLKKQVASIPPARPFKAGDGEIVLDPQLLKSKSPQISSQLAALAHQVKQADEFVLIIARSDDEGRWIYQQLRNAVPGYLVRGDIKLGSPARVKQVKFLE
jgi:hypothetical protein